VSVKQNSYSRQQAAAISGLTARQLAYWRRTGLVAPQQRTRGGHARYSFADLIALRTAKRLIDAGISLQRVRRCLDSLTRFLPATDRPLTELSLIVTGDVVLVFHGDQAFDALTGQQWVFSIAELAREVERMYREVPQQAELFAQEHGQQEKRA
jgi:DNA-binding transcriptional MerR regulator